MPISQRGKLIQPRRRRQPQKQDSAALRPALQKAPELSVCLSPLTAPPLSQQAPLGAGGEELADLGDLDCPPGGWCLSFLIGITGIRAAPPA